MEGCAAERGPKVAALVRILSAGATKPPREDQTILGKVDRCDRYSR